jgi:hypothetical protein
MYMIFRLIITRICPVTVGTKDVVAIVDRLLDNAVRDMLVTIVLGNASIDIELLVASLLDENPVGHALFSSSGII